MTVFLSYSRRQLYFTEMLVKDLQERKISVWFDLQLLYPGCDWKAEINAGLEKSDSLILVASHAALSSPYVELEWRTMLEASKPVYVVLYEAVFLPLELRACPIFDFRASYDTVKDRVSDFITRKTDPPKRVITWVPQLPRPVWLTAAALLTPALTPLVVYASGFSLGGTELLITVLLALWGIWEAIQLLRHRPSHAHLVRTLRMMMTLAFVMGILHSFMTLAALFSGLLGGLLLVAIIPLWLLPFYVNARILRDSPDILRWLNPHLETQAFRERIIGETTKRVTMRGQGWSSYELYAENEPETEAALRNAFESVGILPKATAGTADFGVIVLSNRASQSEVQRMLDTYQSRLIAVVLSPVRLSERLRDILNFQIVDHRIPVAKRLSILASALKGQVSATDYALVTLPQPLDRLLNGFGLTWLVNLLRLWGAFHIAIGLALWLSLQIGSDTLKTALILAGSLISPLAEKSPATLLIYVVLGLVYLALLDMILHRRLNWRAVALSLLGLNLASAVAGILPVIMLIYIWGFFGGLLFLSLNGLPRTNYFKRLSPLALTRHIRVWLLNLIAVLMMVGGLLIWPSETLNFLLALMFVPLFVVMWTYLVSLAFRRIGTNSSR